MNDPRLQQIAAIEAALQSNVGGIRNAHPWIMPLWLEIQRLRQELGEIQSPEAPIKSATEILKDRKEEAEEKKKKPSRRKSTDGQSDSE
jgi:hypothetical protein